MLSLKIKLTSKKRGWVWCLSYLSLKIEEALPNSLALKTQLKKRRNPNKTLPIILPHLNMERKMNIQLNRHILWEISSIRGSITIARIFLYRNLPQILLINKIKPKLMAGAKIWLVFRIAYLCRVVFRFGKSILRRSH